jgi:hypothetical protein
VAGVELYWLWLTVRAADRGQTQPDNRLSMDDWDAIAHPADWTQPKLAA